MRDYLFLWRILILALFVPQIVLALMTLLLWIPPAWCAPKSLTDFSLEELMAMEVTSVAKAPQPLSHAAAAVFVINAEDIRRSGATTIPDLLRMVPGLQVAKIDANKWAVSARGFNGRFANKLLVMVDGRSIYTPLFAGVHWEIHGLMLEDIEVVRGPGGSLWGANAVNGVINIITRHAADTQGTLVSAAAGSQEYAAVTARQGWQSGDGSHARLFAKYSGQGPGEASTHDPADDFHRHRAGLRYDREIDPRASLTLQAEAYGGKAGQMIVEPLLIEPYARLVTDDADFAGGFLLGRWRKEFPAAGELSFQTYLDHGSYEDFVFDHRLTTYDFDFQHRFAPHRLHELTWGLGYRRMDDRLGKTPLTFFEPAKRTDHLWSAFVQDRITLVPDLLEATLGTKWEHNDYTGIEWQPNLRLLYTPHPDHTLWAAVSRAVRTPSRAEEDIRINMRFFPAETPFNPAPFPVRVQVRGKDALKAETIDAYEAGYRSRLRSNLFVDLAFFYNRYRNVIGGKVADFTPVVDPIFHVVQWVESTDEIKGNSHGAEIAASWQVLGTWKVQWAYTYLNLSIKTPDRDGKTLSHLEDTEAPRHQVSLRSVFSPIRSLDLDLWARYVDALSNVATDPTLEKISVPAYITLDARLAWRPRKNLELALVGQNLLERRHAEFAGYDFFEVLATEVPRSLYGKVTWQF